MWRKVLRDIGLKAAQAGVKEALKKVDQAISEPSPEKIEVEVLCPSCKAALPKGATACTTCGAQKVEARSVP